MSWERNYSGARFLAACGGCSFIGSGLCSLRLQSPLQKTYCEPPQAVRSPE